ncbi:STAS domain-containing protein [Cryptosporangium sp. NPDC048952]|uniref:STAS domain-containing protein n=1 Tax=Cryptosporangium sp. NPDC048952 TaxID=3363961 RepID=UPI003711979A
MPHYTCTVQSQPPGEIRITLTGAIDLGSRGDLADAVKATTSLQPKTIHADLSGVSFFSAEGATFLLRLRKLADLNMLSLAPSLPVQRVLAGLGLTDTFRLGLTT